MPHNSNTSFYQAKWIWLIRMNIDFYQDFLCHDVLAMMTSSNENIFRVTGLLYGEFTGLRWIPLTKTSDAELRRNKRLSKQSRRRRFETPLRSLLRHRNVYLVPG